LCPLQPPRRGRESDDAKALRRARKTMISRAKVATVQLGKVIRMSERVVKPSQEIKVKELLSEVEKEIRDWPGMLSAETLVDTADPHRFVVVTEVRRA